MLVAIIAAGVLAALVVMAVLIVAVRWFLNRRASQSQAPAAQSFFPAPVYQLGPGQMVPGSALVDHLEGELRKYQEHDHVNELLEQLLQRHAALNTAPEPAKPKAA